MRLFIAEKPNLAKAIANGLGNGRTENGCIRCGDDTVTWCFGHMLELAWPQEYKPEYAQWRREHLPIIPSEWKYKVKKDSAKQLAVIGSLLREADSVVNAGDPDREGQLLVDEVLEHFKYRGPVARIWLPSLDDKSVRIALNGIKDNAPYAPLRDAARARSLADWLVGINATRAMTIKGREGGNAFTGPRADAHARSGRCPRQGNYQLQTRGLFRAAGHAHPCRRRIYGHLCSFRDAGWSGRFRAARGFHPGCRRS